jgi:hypothetical protein
MLGMMARQGFDPKPEVLNGLMRSLGDSLKGLTAPNVTILETYPLLQVGSYQRTDILLALYQSISIPFVLY